VTSKPEVIVRPSDQYRQTPLCPRISSSRMVGNSEVRIASRYGTLASWLSDKWGVMNSVRYVEFHAITRRDGPLLRPLVACSRLV